jgi:replicative DNA helicase
MLKPDVPGFPDDEGGCYYPLEIGIQTPDGMRQTAYFYDSGVKPTLKLTTRAGYSLTGTFNHPVLVLAKNGRKVWKQLAELSCGDYVAVQRRAAVWDRVEFYRDEITQIEDSGPQHCYDLTVPEGQAFIANGIVCHNTSFMLSAAVNMARLGARIAIFSMEMGVEQIVQRLVSMEAAINSQNLRTGQLTNQEWGRFVRAAGTLSSFRVFIDDTPAMNPIQMRTKCFRLAREHGLDLVIVDYMQLMNAGGAYSNNRVQEISFISRSLKEMARELNVPVLSAAQLSRAVEQRQDKRPVLSDLRESGCLTGDTLVYLPDSGCYEPIAELCGRVGFRVMSLNTETWKLEPGTVTNAFCTGTKPVYRLTTQLGRTIRATANHRFLTTHGWKRLDELMPEDHIALPRRLDGPREQTMDNAERQNARAVNMSVSAVVERLAESDVYWDQIRYIEPDGEAQVYDLTVPGNQCFVANDIVAHNSIEQDSDIVIFLYRDEVYNEATEFPNQADLIISKHRNGPTGTVSLYFEKTLTKFLNAAERSVDLSRI